jgi:hypothetical protein
MKQKISGSIVRDRISLLSRVIVTLIEVAQLAFV